MLKAVLLIDGGHLRSTANAANFLYDPNFVEAFAKRCHEPQTERLIRKLYYDCPQYRGVQRLPVSGGTKHFTASDDWLHDLASRELFAVRRGTPAFRGWIPRAIPIAGEALTDSDFKPGFEQKGVDMRIGLDIATMAAERRLDRILLVSADADLIPAMKHARKAGVQVCGHSVFPAPANALRPQFLAHVDYKRSVDWPPEAVPADQAAPTEEPTAKAQEPKRARRS
jgi:uncharacterized LabA/DUF88 family protein